MAGCGGRGLASELVPLNGTELYMATVGRGEPIVAVHGGPLLDHGYLLEGLRPLADRYELVFYDQRLSGRSAGVVDSASVTLRAFVDDLEAVRERLGLDRVHLLGHSWGGLLAMRYALDHPERVRSLILVSPMAPAAALWRKEEAAGRAGLEPADTAGTGALRASPAFQRMEPAAVERMLQLSFRSQLADPDLADSLRFHVAPDYPERSRLFGLLRPELEAYDLLGELGTLEVPTLLVYGAEEPGPEIGGAAVRRALPHARFAVIPGAGHFAFLERRALFLATVRRFLDR